MKNFFIALFSMYKKLLDYLERVIEFILSVAILIMISSVLGSIFSRNLGISLHWLSELAIFSCIWSIYLGLGLAIKKDLLPGLDLLTVLIPDKWFKIIKIIQDILVIGFLILFVMTSKPLFALLISSGRLSSGMQIPMVFGYLAPLAGSIIAILYSIEVFINHIASENINRSLIDEDEVVLLEDII